jgi:hypothetical protein
MKDISRMKDVQLKEITGEARPEGLGNIRSFSLEEQRGFRVFSQSWNPD